MKRNWIYLIVWTILLHLAAAMGWYTALPWFEYAFTPAFWGLLLLPVLSVHYLITASEKKPSVAFSSLDLLKKYESRWLRLRPHTVFSLKFAALWCCIMALARPQSKTDFEDSRVEGVDIVLALDVSESMLARDFEPNRLEAAKKVAEEFIGKRSNDRIGLVVFQAEAFTQVPLTTDHRVLSNVLRDVRTGLLESGTAIGLGLATAVNRLKESTARSKIIVLLTDGVDNRGAIRPLDAASLAETYGIRVYTIGAGTKGEALQPVARRPDGSFVYDRVKVEIDEEVLTEIARRTNGKYFRATSSEKLSAVYSEIDQLEKTKFNITQFSRRAEEYWRFLLPGLLALLVAWLLAQFPVTTP